MQLLRDLSFSDDHVAKRCAHLIHRLMTVWEKRHRDYVYGGVEVAPPVALSADLPTHPPQFPQRLA